MSNSLWPNELQHIRLPCPWLSPRVFPSLCPLSRWCFPTISSSAALFSFCPQSFLESRFFPVSQLFISGGQSTRASTSVLPMNIQGWFPSVLTCLISFLSKELSRVFSSTTIQKHQFFSAQPSFPGGSTGKESTCNAGELGLIPGLGRSPGEGNGYPLQYSGLENSQSMGLQRVRHDWATFKSFDLLYGPTLTSIYDFWKNHSFIQTFVGKVMSLYFNMLCRFVIAFLPRSRCLLIHGCSHHPQWFWSPRRENLSLLPLFPLCHEVIVPDAMILVFWMLSFKPSFSLSSFTLIKRLFSSSTFCH